MLVLVNNLQEEIPVSSEMLDLAERAALAVLGREGQNQGAEAGIVLVNDRYIHQLNREYRGVDSPTDVLSFALQEGEESIPGFQEEGLILGDVVISLETAQRQSREYGHSLEREVAYLTVHGVLHLLGYEHRTDGERRIMRQIEEEVLQGLRMTRE